ncbi:MAG: right-handed parallel beta-helix repeat-containing protein [Kiritimatiellae bacterium]|nr:right-handed parallel beta-helix repeat-containing protein [Kiritimatiellia bacterium]
MKLWYPRVLALALCTWLGRTVFAAEYYINDAGTAGDVWCVSVGSVTNAGTSSNAPALHIQDVLAAHDIEPGDVIYVDAGSYTLPSNVTVTAADSGSSGGGMVTIKGVAGATVLDRGTSGGDAYAIALDQAEYVRVEDMMLTHAGRGVHIELGQYNEIRNCEIVGCGIGVVLAWGAHHTISGCKVHHNSVQGILGSSSSSITVSGTDLYGHASSAQGRGIELFSCEGALIDGGSVYSNGAEGIHLSSCASVTVSGNAIHENSLDGLYLSGCSAATVTGNTVWQNTNGLYATSAPLLTLAENRLHANIVDGAHVQYGTATVRNNLLYANGTMGLDTVDAGASTIRNNTFYGNGAAGLQLWGNYDNVAVYNNVLTADEPGRSCLAVDKFAGTWYSDYNAFWATNEAVVWDWWGPRHTLSSWQILSDRDWHSLDIDPLPVDIDGADNVLAGAGGADDDFHLQSTAGSHHGGSWAADGAHSLCIDAGDPDTAYAAEPAENGSRANLGAYGGTAEASKSTAARELRVLFPRGTDIHFRRVRVRWAITGPWTTNDQVKVEYSPDAGGSWFDCLNANPLNADNGVYGWDVGGLTPGTQYWVKVTYLADTNIADACETAFEILDPAGKTLYINDDALAGDQWCSATGTLANTGLSPADPFSSFQIIVDTYPELGAGDEVRMDAGSYSEGTIYLGAGSSGHPGSNLVIRGTGAGSTVVDRMSSTYDVFRFDAMDHIRVQDLTMARGHSGVEASGTSDDWFDGLQIVGCEIISNASYGLDLRYCTNAVVNTNTCRVNVTGIMGNPIHGEISANICYSNASGYGISASGAGALVVADNVCYSNRIGLAVAAAGTEANRNQVYANEEDGLSVTVDATARRNTAYGNGRDGMATSDGTHVEQNVVHANGRYGINASCGIQQEVVVVANNLVYSNGSYNAYLYSSWGPGLLFENNTLYGGNGLYVQSGAGDPVTNRNNIVWAGGDGKIGIYAAALSSAFGSDYNDLYAADGAHIGYWQGYRTSLKAWQSVTLQDGNSLSIAPVFVDADACDFHLQSTAGSYGGDAFTAPTGGTFAADAGLSFCIDAGHPASAYAHESADNGGRVNMGAFGNTADASRSPGERVSLLVEPNGGVEWFGTQTITWLTRGPWTGGDTVKLEYSDNGGTNWYVITNSVDYAAGACDWNTGAVTPGADYLVRVSKSDDSSASDTSDAPFAISADGPKTYYVNDASTTNDVYTTAAGDDGNDGLGASSPKATLQSVLDTYSLRGGDVVKIDTGTYTLTGSIIITTNDAGSTGNPVTFLGNTNSPATVLDRGNLSESVFYLHFTDCIRLQNLVCRGGSEGVRVEGTSEDFCTGVEIVQCEAYSNNYYGLYLTGCSNLTVEGNACHDQLYYTAVGIGGNNLYGEIRGNACWAHGDFNNCAYGITIWEHAHVVVENNVVHDILGGGIRVEGADAVVRNNHSYSNTRRGIEGSAAELSGNVVYLNGGEGVTMSGAVLQQNVVQSNKATGVEAYACVVVNNLLYHNGYEAGDYWNLRAHATPLVANNTVYGGSGMQLNIGDYAVTTNRNNIVWGTGAGEVAIKVVVQPNGDFVSDYNNLYATDGAVVGYWQGTQAELADWQYATRLDRQSFSAEPGFVDRDGADEVLGGLNWQDDNFHLASTAGSYTGQSFTASGTDGFATNATTGAGVDAGDLADSAGDELPPNGNRINLGAFGGTAEASLSPEEQAIVLAGVDSDTVLRGAARVTWRTRGPWTTDDAVTLEYSADGGTNWNAVLGAESVPCSQAYHDWDTSGLTPGEAYRLRASKSDEPGVNDTSAEFRVLAPGPRTFYVNDADTAGDVYTAVAGVDTNDGLSAATPKATVKRLLRDYTLVPGDVVAVDTGNWLLDSTLELFDSGSAAQTITFRGSTNTPGSVLDRNAIWTGERGLLLGGTDHVRLENLTVCRATYGIHVDGSPDDGCDGVQIAGCEVYSNDAYGIAVEYCTNLLAVANVCRGPYGAGLATTYTDSWLYGDVTSNDCSELSTGIDLRMNQAGALLLTENVCHGNSGFGFRVGGAGSQIEGNVACTNTACGIEAYGVAVLRGNRSFLNDGTGIEGSAPILERNVVYGNGMHGIYALGGTVANNLAYANGDADGEYNLWVSDGVAANNTAYGGNGLYASVSSYASGTNRHNIVWAQGVNKVAVKVLLQALSAFESDHNCLLATGGAAVGYWLGTQTELADWQYATGWDANSFSAEPDFVDVDGADDVLGGTGGLDDNFHLASTAGSYTGLSFTAEAGAGFATNGTTSVCVDAGDPAAAVGGEAAPNGARLNLGAFGGTADASLSPEQKALTLAPVVGGEVLRATRRVSWLTRGPWNGGDTVTLEYSTDGGTNWNGIAGAESIPYDQGGYDWDTSGLTPGTGYTLRAKKSDEEAVNEASGEFRVLAAEPTVFYVNDTSTSNDVYTSAVGHEANDGISASTPKATLKRLLRDFTLMPGDVVRVDTGTWVLDASLQLFDSGSATQKITVVGSTNSPGTVLNRNDASQHAVYLFETDDVRLESLKVTGGNGGVRIEGSATNACDGIQVASCDIYGNSQGIWLSGATNVLISGNTCRNQTGSGAGIYCHYEQELSGEISGNDCYENQTGISVDHSGGPLTVADNTVHENNYTGLSAGSAQTAVTGNRVYLNSGDGIYAGSAGEVRRNVVYSNGGHGINGGRRLVNNLAYANGDAANEANIQTDNAVVENNTVYGGNGIRFNGWDARTNKDNIAWATGADREALRFAHDGAVSDGNNLYASDGASVGCYCQDACTTLADWQGATGLDSNSLSVDPYFVDRNGADDLLGDYYGEDDDFHLQSAGGSYHAVGLWTNDLTNSPCIDAGEHWSVYSNEPAYNGFRVNQGAYGNTEYASKTDYAGPFYTLTTVASPANGGSISAWPLEAAYPTNRQTTLSATLNTHFNWGQWTGDVNSADNPAWFLFTGNMVVTAAFDAVADNTNGVPNWWLAEYNIATNQTGAEADDDSDGHFNWQEYFAGTDPTNGASLFQIESVERGTGARLPLTFTTVADRTYQPYVSTNLTTNGWAIAEYSDTDGGALGTNAITGTGNPITIYLEPADVARFYLIDVW